ncbi:hypothetical protein QBC45DRAFT_335325, partial [Copromyces sp. CBS 386.78]
PILKALYIKVYNLLKDRIKKGILEESYIIYCNNWFLVIKKDRGLRLVNDI